MRGPRVAIDAAVFAAAVGIDRLREWYVRRIVVRDDAARDFRLYLRRRRADLLLAPPAVLLRQNMPRFEAPFALICRAAALDRCLHGHTVYKNSHCMQLSDLLDIPEGLQA